MSQDELRFWSRIDRAGKDAEACGRPQELRRFKPRPEDKSRPPRDTQKRTHMPPTGKAPTCRIEDVAASAYPRRSTSAAG